MELNQVSNRIHPLVAGAAVSVMLVSLLGVAAITGVLPSSHATATDAALLKTQADVAALKSVARQQIASAPTVEREVIENKPVVHHHYVQHARPIHVAQAAPHQYYSQEPVYQQRAPVAYNSPVGIGLGAVVGGLLGSQVGGGNGRTAAAIAGAVGGGYLGNEIARRQQ